MNIRQLSDIHTHTPGRSNALLSVEPSQILPDISHSPFPILHSPFSLSLHPWHLTPSSAGDFNRCIEHCKDNPMLMGIGECGLDNHCDTQLALQKEAFLLSLRTARQMHLPVIVHCVGYWAEMMECVREVWGASGANAALSDGVPIIIHGFRKGPDLTRQLLAAGFCISLGNRYNTASAELIPADRLFRETDEDNNIIDTL